MAHFWDEATRSLATLQCHFFRIGSLYATLLPWLPVGQVSAYCSDNCAFLQSRMWVTDHWKVLVFPTYQGERKFASELA